MAGIAGIYLYNDKGEIIGATGAKLATMKIKQKHGDDFFKRTGSLGGSVKGTQGGFAADRQRAAEAGRLGGSISRRTKAKKENK